MVGLEREIIGALNSIEVREARSKTYQSFVRNALYFLVVWPLLAAILVGVLLKFGWGKFVLRHSIVLAAVAAVPVVATGFARKLAAMRVVAMQKQAIALQEKKLKLISRIKVELPMKEALELLLRYDPKGDHKASVKTVAWGQAAWRAGCFWRRCALCLTVRGGSYCTRGSRLRGVVHAFRSSNSPLLWSLQSLIELPAEYKAEVTSLKREKEELASLMDQLLEKLATATAAAAEPADADGEGVENGVDAGDELAGMRSPAPSGVPSGGGALQTPGPRRRDGGAPGTDAGQLLSQVLRDLPPGSVDLLRRQQKNLPKSTPIINRLLAPRAPGTPPGVGGGFDSWLVSHVVATPAPGEAGVRPPRTGAKSAGRVPRTAGRGSISNLSASALLEAADEDGHDAADDDAAAAAGASAAAVAAGNRKPSADADAAPLYDGDEDVDAIAAGAPESAKGLRQRHPGGGGRR